MLGRLSGALRPLATAFAPGSHGFGNAALRAPANPLAVQTFSSRPLLPRVASNIWTLPASAAARGGLAGLTLGTVRGKQTKRQSYRKDARASPCQRPLPTRAHLGIKAMSSEYVEAGRIICKQRKFIAKNPNVTRNRHFKIYPGVNVRVMKNTSLQAMISGRVKMTHDVTRDVKILNVLAEPREELLRDDLWRYRTEHVESMQENTELCNLRAKALHIFGKASGWVNQPEGPKPMRARIANHQDSWNNPSVRDPFEIEPFDYPMGRALLARHIRKVRRRQAGVPEEDNDPEFQTTDTKYERFKGLTAQR